MTVNVSKPALNLREKISELDKPSGVAGQDILKADTPQEVFNYINAGRRNLIINGAMQVYQRDTGSAITIGATRKYVLDRFSHYTGDGAFTVDRSTDVPTTEHFGGSMKLSCTTAASSPTNESYIHYAPEAQDLQCLGYGTSNAKTMTISFWVKSNLTGDTGFYLYQNDGARAYQTTYTINSANTWEKKTIVIPGDTSGQIDDNSDGGMEIRWYMRAASTQLGSDYQNAWSGNSTNRGPASFNFLSSTSNTFYLTGVQLELGSIATPFEHRLYGEELVRCQRYFERIEEDQTSLDSTSGSTSTEMLIGIGVSYSGTRCLCRLDWKQQKRVPPTITWSSDSNIQTLSAAQGWESSSGVSFRANVYGARIDLEAANAHGNGAAIEVRFNHSSIDDWINIDAEL